MVVFGEDAATSIDVVFHPVHRTGMGNERIAVANTRVGGSLIAATVEDKHVVLIKVGGAVPQGVGGVGIGRGGSVEADAFSRAGRLLVHTDAAAPARVGELAGIHAHATQKALKAIR